MKATTLRKMLRDVWLRGYRAGWSACGIVAQNSIPLKKEINEDFDYEVNVLIENFEDAMMEDKK